MKKIEIFLISLILVLGFLVRLYRFDGPIADWHSWRQADASAVSRNFVKYGFDVLHPRFDDLSNVASGFDNPNGYRFVEFPLYNLLQGGFYLVFGFLTLEQWGRLITISFSLLSSFFIYLIVKKHLNWTGGLLAAFFYTFLPFSIYFGRTILADTSMVMAVLGGTYFFDKWLEEFKTQNLKLKILYFLLSLLFILSSFLLKPYALFFTLPIIYLVFEKFGFGFIKRWQLWIFAIVTLAPLVFWRTWMQQFPEGIPVSDWLFNGGNIRFKGSFFYWIFADRIGRLILGYWGIFIFSLGIIRKLDKKNMFFFFSFIVSSLLYLFVIARGNVQHDYYQILIIPTIAIFLGLGGEFLLNSGKENLSRVASIIMLIILSLFSIFFGWYFVRDYFNINDRSIIIAGKAVDKLTPKNAKIIAPYDGNTAFLYQTNRQGWTSFEKPLPEMVKMGANYLVLLNPTEKDFSGIGKTYKVMSSTKDYIIFDLDQKL